MSTSTLSNLATDDPMGGADEEKITEAGKNISYFGTHELHDSRMLHQIEMAIFHNRVTTSHTGYYKIAGD